MNKIKQSLKKIIPPQLMQTYHLVSAVAASYWYGRPGRQLRLIAVTGTNGKTTTCYLLRDILSASGRQVGMTTTVSFAVNDTVQDNISKMTTINPWRLQKLLKQMVTAGCEDAVIEATSIASHQHRLWGLKWQAVVFTNLTHDHLDYHGDMEHYRQAKEQLFANRPGLTVINQDDPAAGHFLKYQANRTLTYGVEAKADVMAKKVFARSGGSDFVLLYDGRQAAVNLPLPGAFNVANALAAATTALGLGVSIETITDSLNQAQPVPGRMEAIDAGQSFTVIVDYAHTPDALEKVFSTIKPTVLGKLITVFGATGERDSVKRPVMGELAAASSDITILTTDDPYHEDPADIIDQIIPGLSKGHAQKGKMKVSQEGDVPIKYQDNGENDWWYRIIDRKQAIAKALELARPQDVVLVLGKGAEKVMVVGDKHLPWNDRQVLEELLKKHQA